MSARWGVNCATCGVFIELDEQDKGDFVTTYLPEENNKPIPCKCGSSHLYTSKDVVDEHGVLLNPWPESA
jgi:hypothetical protein